MLKSYPGFREFLRKTISEVFRKHSMPRWMLFLHDSVAVFFTFFIAYLLRFNLAPSGFELNHAIIHGLIALFVYTVFMLIFRSYAGLIRHTTLTDVSLVFVSSTSAAFVLVLLSLGEQQLNFNNHLVIPISIILIHYVLISVYLFFTRIFAKMLFRFGTSSIKNETKRVLIYGAGEMFYCQKGYLKRPQGRLYSYRIH